jgi:hypothetical protein
MSITDRSTRAATVLIPLLAAPGVLMAQTSRVIELCPPAGYAHSAARGVNGGIAVGRAWNIPSASVPVRWDLTNPCQPTVMCGGQILDAVNVAGHIVGGVPTSAVIIQNGACSFLPNLPGYAGAFPFDINSDGQTIVGWSFLGATRAATLWNRSGTGPWTVMALDPLGGAGSNANGISETGHVAGWADDPTASATRPIIWSPPSYAAEALPHLGFGGACWDISGGIPCGFVATASGSLHAAFWNAGVPNTVGALPPRPNAWLWDINLHGEMVGWAFGQGDPFDDPMARAVIVSPTSPPSSLTDLNDRLPPASPWILREAWYINDRGEIAGRGSLNGLNRGFVLLPCYANCDRSTVPPVLNVDDFTCFINAFAIGQTLPHAQQVTAYANCDGSTTAPALNVDDFTCFINGYALGCQ